MIFLDRDGVINIDKSYVYKIEDFEFCEYIFDLCSFFKKLNYELIVITNQSGIGRKYYSIDDFNKLTNWMKNRFKEEKIEILDIFYCPHAPEDKCNCRKPKAGMIKDALEKYDIDLNNSWFIGDKLTDIKAAINGNVKNHILINSKYNQPIKEESLELQYVVNNLYEIVKIVKE